jgi:hypothetical protein
MPRARGRQSGAVVKTQDLEIARRSSRRGAREDSGLGEM